MFSDIFDHKHTDTGEGNGLWRLVKAIRQFDKGYS